MSFTKLPSGFVQYTSDHPRHIIRNSKKSYHKNQLKNLAGFYFPLKILSTQTVLFKNQSAILVLIDKIYKLIHYLTLPQLKQGS